jgi:hypothetical protein
MFFLSLSHSSYSSHRQAYMRHSVFPKMSCNPTTSYPLTPRFIHNIMQISHFLIHSKILMPVPHRLQRIVLPAHTFPSALEEVCQKVLVRQEISLTFSFSPRKFSISSRCDWNGARTNRPLLRMQCVLFPPRLGTVGIGVGGLSEPNPHNFPCSNLMEPSYHDPDCRDTHD